MLNWNSAADTIECLESVLKSDYEKLNVIVVDNNSQDDSIEQIKSWASGTKTDIKTNLPDLVLPLVDKPLQLLEVPLREDEQLTIAVVKHIKKPIPVGSIVLIKNHENTGFAQANNLGVELSRLLFQCEYFFLLNNDTVIDKSCVSNLVETMEANNDWGVATSAIYYYYDPARTANIGGRITFLGSRRYYTEHVDKEITKITFATGCALFVRDRIFQRVGLLSNRFFFGEEDFEFSWRLRKNNIPIVCITSSKVYHKIGISADKLLTGDLKRKFFYVFNRVIDMKHIYSPFTWRIWRLFLLLYSFIWLSSKHRIKISRAIAFCRAILHYTTKYDDAKRVTIETIDRELLL